MDIIMFNTLHCHSFQSAEREDGSMYTRPLRVMCLWSTNAWREIVILWIVKHLSLPRDVYTISIQNSQHEPFFHTSRAL